MAKLVGAISSPLEPYLDVIKSKIDSLCEGLQPWKIVVYTCGGTLIVIAVKNLLFDEEESLKQRVIKSFFRNVKKIPYISRRIAEEKVKIRAEMEASISKGVDKYVISLPAKGLTTEEVLHELDEYKKLAGDSWKLGQVSGTVYSGDPELTELMTKTCGDLLKSHCQLCVNKCLGQTYGKFAWTNPLHADVFPDIRKMEAEVVRMTCSLFNGDSETCGTMSAGGTESILLACLSYRNRARDRGVRFPEIIAPKTVHAAFDKAAAFFRMKITHIPLDEKTMMVDVKAMKRAINSSTCMLVGSAPQFPHGIIDPIKEISELGLKYNIPVHVDSCLGGFLVPFMEKAGYPIPVCDFRLPGVTSISADTHKYAFAPKGSSVIMYRNMEYRRPQIFVQPDWPGGIYATSTVSGSRPGAIIAACWATLMHIGEDGYVDSTRRIIKTARYIAQELRKITGIKVFGEPLMSVIGIGSDNFNVFLLADLLTSQGWNLNPLQFPSSIHLCCTLLHTKEGVADRFLTDVRNAAEQLLNDPDAKAEGKAAIYGMAQTIPDRTMVSDCASCFVEAVYSTNKVDSNGVTES